MARSIDERLDALTMNLEVFHVELVELRKKSALDGENIRQDAENIRALARIAEIHERRLTLLEDGGEA
jgi:hypothetical protein